VSRHGSVYLILSITALAVALAQVGAYYYFEKLTNAGPSSSSVLCGYLSSNSSAGSTILVNTLVNYGNNTVRWYNQTRVPSSWNAYDLTLYLTRCNVEATFYGSPLNEHLITSINEVREHGSFSWTLWAFCQDRHAWAYSSVGSDLVRLADGEILAWFFESSSPTGIPNSPQQGTSAVSTC
jgi:hypothetical protein